MKAPRTLSIDLEGQQVKVYRNLKYKGLFSVQFGGLVVAHLATVQLTEVVFKVTETGRQRVISQRQRNVHAYAIGTFRSAPQPRATEPINYNPYHAGLFLGPGPGPDSQRPGGGALPRQSLRHRLALGRRTRIFTHMAGHAMSRQVVFSRHESQRSPDHSKPDVEPVPQPGDSRHCR